MIHDVDLVCNLLDGHEVVAVSGSGQAVKSGRLDFVQSILQFDHGVQASCFASRVTADKIRELDIHTSSSFIKANLLSKTLMICRNANMVIDEGQDSAYRQESMTEKIFIPIVEPLRAELLSFHRSITEGSGIEVDGNAAIRAISLCEAIQKQCGQTAAAPCA